MRSSCDDEAKDGKRRVDMKKKSKETPDVLRNWTHMLQTERANCGWAGHAGEGKRGCIVFGGCGFFFVVTQLSTCSV